MRAHSTRYATVHRALRNRVFENLSARYVDGLVPVNLRKVGAKAALLETDGLPRAMIRSVLTCEYARSDLATAHVYQAMSATCFSECEKSAGTFCVNILPI